LSTTETRESIAPARVGALGWLLAFAVLAISLVWGLQSGSVDIDPLGSIGVLLDLIPGVEIDHGLNEIEQRVILEIRAPRIAMGAIVGAVLAVAGAGYQGVFRNPLADPYLLGVAAGAGLGATFVFAFEGASDVVPILAFLGGLGAVALTYVLGKSVGGRTTTSLILAGVAVAAFATAIQTFLLQRNLDTLREVYSWILGRLVTVGWGDVITLLPYAVVASVVLLIHGRLLDVLALGDDEAEGLGVRVVRVRSCVVLAATLATAAAVSVSGLIGFVGLIVPHTVRLLTGWSYRVIIPLSIIYGASFLVVADLIARTAAAPAEIPIGVVTAFLGAPFFVLVLRTMRGPQ
jgi:iron complex transport system permease protein